MTQISMPTWVETTAEATVMIKFRRARRGR